MPVVPPWLLEPLQEQFSALLAARPVYDPAHPLGCHRPRISDRIIFDKLVQVLPFGCADGAADLLTGVAIAEATPPYDLRPRECR